MPVVACIVFAAWRIDVCQTEVVRWHDTNWQSSMQICNLLEDNR